jgi:hypothetical protein
MQQQILQEKGGQASSSSSRAADQDAWLGNRCECAMSWWTAGNDWVVVQPHCGWVILGLVAVHHRCHRGDDSGSSSSGSGYTTTRIPTNL